MLVFLGYFAYTAGASPAVAGITVAGNVSPAYPGSDPWHVGMELRVGDVAAGSLTIDAGSKITSIGAAAGVAVNTIGSIVLSGDESTWTNSGALLLGVHGAGTLDVQSGAQVSSVDASLGHVDGSGQAMVQGIGSRWINTGQLIVGNGSSGGVTISDGGQVTSDTALVGLNSAAIGSVVVEGEQSAWHITEALQLGNVDDGGQARLSLLGSGSRVYVGSGAGSYGEQFPIEETALVVSAVVGTAQLEIFNGNVVENAGNAYVAIGPDDVGQVSVDGAGSSWSNDGDVTLGGDGVGILSLRNGARASAGGPFWIGPQGTVEGRGTIEANTVNLGAVVPGEPVGNLAIIGDYTQSSVGKLQIELAGTSVEQFGTLAISGNASLNGILEVTLGTNGGNPFEPQLGDSFFVLSASSIAGQFANVSLPPLPSELMWDIDVSSAVVTLAVVEAVPGGDYNGNGVVDAADYTVWRDTFGQSVESPGDAADGNRNGVVDINDHNVWKHRFGEAADASTTVQTTITPEPATVSLGLITLAVGLASRRRTGAMRGLRRGDTPADAAML